jgi:cytochrome c-type biogenesis protein CcsB
MKCITMHRLLAARVWLLMLCACGAFFVGFAAWAQNGASSASASAVPFAQAVDLEPLATLAVQSDGRLKSFSSFASETMSFVSGPKKIGDQDALFTYLDMLFRPDAYRQADVIYVKGAGPRKRIADALLSTATDESRAKLEASMQAFAKTGLISEANILNKEVVKVLREMRGDLIRTEKVVRAIDSAITVKDPRFLLSKLRMVPRGDGDQAKQWHGIAEVMFAEGKEPVPGAMLLLAEREAPPEDISPEQSARIGDAWRQLVMSWLKGDAPAANQAILALSTELPALDPTHYPDRTKLWWEHWYFENDHMTRVWLVYMAASIFLLLGFVWKWPRARWIGFAIFALAVLLHTAAVGLRWYIAGRWPNSNMFEAVTTAAWMGAVCAIAIEWWVRRTAMFSLFALGAAVSAMVAMMAAHFLPVQLNPAISNMMPVLHDVWLYIHTNVIIFSYVLIFMAAVSAAMYIVHRWLGGTAEFARVGGAASLIVAGPHGEERMVRGRAGFGEILDGTTMVLMEISFVLLWAGIVMGAIWADHSWGRPWGWDPKEVFALNTFIVFAVLVHVRLKVKDKGLWTAWLAVIGAAVMLFNWIVINFVITGLHSYA